MRVELEHPFFAMGDVVVLSRNRTRPAGFLPVPILEAEHILRSVGAPSQAARIRDFVDAVRLFRREEPMPPLDTIESVVDLVELDPMPGDASETEHWIEVRVLDEGHAPLVDEAIACATPDGKDVSGATAEGGRFFVDGIGKAGTCLVELPGLSEHVPEPLPLAMDAIHTIVVPGLRFVHLCLVDFEAHPVAGRACTLVHQQAEVVGVTDAAGNVSFRVATGLDDAHAQLRAETEALGHAGPRPVRVAPLPPPSTPEGQRERLDNLGYIPVDAQPDDPPSLYAVEEFQCDHGLVVTGVCDAATQTKLAEVHGH